MKIEENVMSVDMSKFTIAEPTRICLVCKRKENPLSDTVNTDKAWLCDRCELALNKLVSITN